MQALLYLYIGKSYPVVDNLRAALSRLEISGSWIEPDAVEDIFHIID